MHLGVEKANEDYIDRIFLWERFQAGECWMTREEFNMRLEETPRKGAKLSSLKDQITFWVICFRIIEHHTA